ncbi:NAD(P)H-quinone oxidoreductase, partial [Myxococcus sp. 1LA]
VLCDTKPPRFADAVREATGGRGADLCLDLVGATTYRRHSTPWRPRGRLMLVGLVAGGGHGR